MADRKYAHEKNAARDKARRTPYHEPIPAFCPMVYETGRCEGNLHVVDRLHGEPVEDSQGVPTKATICDKCHHVTIYEVAKGEHVARNMDAKKKARVLADELEKTGVLFEADGTKRRLTVKVEGKHYKVRAANGAYLFSFATTPSDTRTLRNCEAQLKRLNVRWGEDALKAAPPAINGSKTPGPPSADELTPVQQRGIAVRARLATLKQQLGATSTELVRLGIDAAEKRGAWHYKTVESGVVQIGRFLGGRTYGDHRSLDFFEMLCDELEGTQVEQRTRVPKVASTPPTPPTPEPTPPTPEPKPEPVVLPPGPFISEAEWDAAQIEISELKKERLGLLDEIDGHTKYIQELRADLAKQALKLTESEQRSERLRAETISAESVARVVKEETEELRRELAAKGAGSDDPLFIKALRRLIDKSSTDDEIREAFEMAMQIYKGGM